MTQQQRRLLLTRSPHPAPRATTKTDVGCHRGHGSHGTSLSSGLVIGRFCRFWRGCSGSCHGPGQADVYGVRGGIHLRDAPPSRDGGMN
jgi:hypothetical protein